MIRLRSKFDRLKEGLAACRNPDEARDYWNDNFDAINSVLEPHQIEKLIELRDRHGGTGA